MELQLEQPTENRLRTLETEIRGLARKTAVCMLEMGDKLIEAKSIVPHGQWEVWLKNNVELSTRTARNLMTIARAFSENRQAIAVLNVTALYLLAEMPAQDRELFLLENDVGNMTTRELKSAIDERKQMQVLMEPIFTDEMRLYGEKILQRGNLEEVKEWRSFLLWLGQEVGEIVIDAEVRLGELLMKEETTRPGKF